MDFLSAKVAKQMGKYKREYLGIIDNYMWNGVEYEHILAQDLWDLNLLDPIRDDLKEFINNGNSGIRLHHKIHHMNSSQAMCLNLFFPLYKNNELSIFAKCINVDVVDIQEFEYEKIMLPEEGTNFDAFMEDSCKKRIFIEAKYTENEFGKGNEKSHKEKRDSIYKMMLKDVITEDVINSDLFYKNYQLFRNLSYVNYKVKDGYENHVCVVTTEKNTKIHDQYNAVLSNVASKYKSYIHFVTIEELITAFNERCCAATKDCTKYFADKYLIKD